MYAADDMLQSPAVYTINDRPVFEPYLITLQQVWNLFLQVLVHHSSSAATDAEAAALIVALNWIKRDQLKTQLEGRSSQDLVG